MLADVKRVSAIAKLIRMLFWSVSSLDLLIPHKLHEKNVVIFVISFGIIVQNLILCLRYVSDIVGIMSALCENICCTIWECLIWAFGHYF